MWVQRTIPEPKFWINKDSGRLYWNLPLHLNHLGRPVSLTLWHDAAEHRIGVMGGMGHIVQNDKDDHYIEAKQDLIAFGLVFPLAQTREYTPVWWFPSEGEAQTGSIAILYFDLDAPL